MIKSHESVKNDLRGTSIVKDGTTCYQIFLHVLPYEIKSIFDYAKNLKVTKNINFNNVICK